MTRLYFSNNQQAAVTSPIPPGWNLIGGASYWRLTQVKDPTDLLSNGSTIGPIPPNLFAADRVYISDRLDVQLLQGTISLYLQTLESNADDDVISAIEIYVIDEFGRLRQVILPRGHYGSSTEYATSYTNRAFLLNTPIAPITTQLGDRIVIVIGHNAGIGAVSANASARYGSDSALDDLAANETQTGSGIGFALFSATIVFADTQTGGTDHSGVDCIDDPNAPPTVIPPTETPPPVPVYTRIEQDRPPIAIPHEGVEEFIQLIRVDGNTTDGFTYKVHKILSVDYKMLEWHYHRKGGCGTFRLLTLDQNILVDFADRTAYAWELWVRIRLPGEAFYSTWYRGEIKSVTTEQSGGELITDVRGVGYIEQLQSMYISRIFPAGMTVRQIVDDLLEEYIVPGTRITRADLKDVTNFGMTESTYETRGPLRFECSVYRALKFLAELQGDIEWGIDSEARFFWKQELTVPGKAFFLENDANYTRAGAYNDLATKVRFEGNIEGGRELLRIVNDVTDPTDPIKKQEYCRVTEHPWVAHPDDAQHWADNLLIVRRRMQHWRVVKWANVTSKLEANHPVAGLRRVLYRDAADVTNEFSEYEISRIRYIKGGIVKTQIYEKGRTKTGQDGKFSTLSAEVWLGAPPKGLAEEIEGLADDIDALKGKWKQFRAIPDVTTEDRLREEIRPRTTGELRFLTFGFNDPTNAIDVTNSPIIFDPTKQGGVLVMYDGKQWVKQSFRKTYWPALPDAGFFAGELATLLSDVTNRIGELWKWTGSVWESMASGGVPDVLQLTEQGSTPSTPPTGDWKFYFTSRGPAFVEDNGDVFELEDYPQGRRGWTVFDEFLQHNIIVTGGAHSSKEGWNRVISGAAAAITKVRIDNNHPGVVRLDTGTALNGRATLHLDFDGQTFGGGRVLYECMLRVPIVPTIPEDFTVWAGYGDNSGGGKPQDGVGLVIDRLVSTTNWLRYAYKAAGETRNDSGTPFTTAWVKLGFLVNAAGTSVEYFIDDVSVGTETTNIPINASEESGLWFKIEKSAGGTARTIEVDYVRCRQWLTNPR